MGDWSNIEGALVEALVTEFTTEYPLIFENEPETDGTAKAPEGNTHMEAFLLPGETQNIEVSDGGKQRAIGVFQVTIRTPLYQGKYEMNTIRDRIVDTAYLRNKVLTRSGTNVRILTSVPEQSSEIGSFYTMPVTINWQADI